MEDDRAHLLDRAHGEAPDESFLGEPTGAAAAALICFIFAWNEYFLANLLTAVVARTTPPFLGSFVDGRGQFLAVLSAAATIAALPVIIAGWAAQKQLVRGLSMGAIK